jgi:hypothetical protein
LWITLLLLMDKDGFIVGTDLNIARVANITSDQFEKSIEILLSNDKYSEIQTFNGKRIERVECGFKILNHKRYI